MCAHARISVLTTAWLVAACIATSPTGALAQAAAPDEVMPVTIAEDLLDDAMRQELEGSAGVPANRSRSGKVGLGLLLALTVVGARVQWVRRSRTAGDLVDAGEPAESTTSPAPDGEPSEGESRSSRKDRPYRSPRAPAEVVPLALPPHVVAILARTSAPGATAEGGPAPYHAPDQPAPSASAPDEPPQQRLDLVVPGFTPWRKEK